MSISIKRIVACALGLAFALSAPAIAPAKTASMHSASYRNHKTTHSIEANELRVPMGKLWQDHVLWTRLVIVSMAAGLPDATPTTERLLRNQNEIGNAVKPYYGTTAGNKLTALLRIHIQQAAAVVSAAKANDTIRLEAAKRDWFANADQIADFLSTANPRNWPRSEMRQMMHDHLNLTLAEATDQLQGHYGQSVADYDRVEEEILKMADALSDGIARQFPNKVRLVAMR